MGDVEIADTERGFGFLPAVLSVGFALFAAFHIYTSLFGTFEPLVQRGIFIGVGVGGTYLAILASGQPRKVASRVALGLLAVAGFSGGLHVVLGAERFMDIMYDLTPTDQIVAVVMIVAVLEGARRSIGWAMPVLAVAGLVYYLFGNALITGSWRPPTVSAQTSLTVLYSSTYGIFGFMSDIGSRVIAIYVTFGAVIMSTGAGEVFMRLARTIAGRTHGGAAKVAVLASAMFGTISGSAVANVMAVGSITIPTMVRARYPSAFAAGVEASASAGGQIMPPIMGAGAFIMAELLNVPYWSVATAALIPAILYFGAIYTSIDLFARLKNLQRESMRDASQDWAYGLRNTLPLVGSIAVLMVLLAQSYTATFAGACALLSLVLLSLGIRLYFGLRQGGVAAAKTEIAGLAGEIWVGLVNGGKNLVFITVLLACAGLLVAVLTSSGLGAKFSVFLVTFTGDGLLPLLIVAAVLCILLGMDVPTTASYVLTASVAAPMLIKFGLSPITAHLFIFYFAVLSAITPPVCASVYAAATLSGDNFWRVAGQALRIAGAVFFIPFLFVFRQELLLIGGVEAILYHFVVAGLAVVMTSVTSIGYWIGPLTAPMRCASAAVVVLLIYNSTWSDVAGIALALALSAVQFVRSKR